MKKTLKIVLALAAMSLAFVFAACNNNSSDSSNQSTASFSGTYTGSISLSGATKGSMTLYCTVVGTGNNYTVKYSVLSWANAMITRGNGANNEYVKTVNLAKALYQYWAAADAYFAIH